MNKFFVTFCSIFVLVSFVYAGFTGPSIATSKVKDIKKMKDDTNIVLVGKIEKSLGGEKYQFADETGTITIEIDEEKWQGLEVGPADTIEIYGEVEKNWKRTKVDVDRIIKK